VSNAIVPHPASSGIAAGVLARVGQIAMVFALIVVLLFGAAGTFDWAWAFAYLAIYVASVAVNAWFLRHSPELVAERGRPAEPTPTWDKVLGGAWGIAAFVALPIVAGLDVRFGWTGPVGAAWHVLGGVLFAAGLGLFGWAMVTNAYFSTAARIQEDRDQQVCRSGPYRFVRHPGYSGTVLQAIGAPLLLGSVWALVPAAVAIACMAVRTRFEDHMLMARLPGYADYAREVPHRLIPLAW
jgi:protein-S-isoprenylcysteine O-methyltransferase Ste14